MMDLVGLPLTSIVSFILAGMLIGHAIWSRDRSGDAERIGWLEKRYMQARQIARQRKLELRNLSSNGDRKQHELGTLQQKNEANVVKLKALERSSKSTAQQLEALRGQLVETKELLSAEQRRNNMLVEQLQGVLKEKDAQAVESSKRLESVAQQNAAEIADRDFKLSNVQEQLEELLPLRAESVQDSLIIAEQRIELAEAAKQREASTVETELPLEPSVKTPTPDPPSAPPSENRDAA